MFKQYSNKSSLKKQYSRYVHGGYSEQEANFIGWWEKVNIQDQNFDDIVIFKLPKCYDKRPDLLSSDLYGRADFEWVILQFNNIVDINEEFVVGAKLRVPSRLRVFTDIMANNVGNTNVYTS